MKLPKVYEPGQYEADIYALWEKAGAFQPSGTGKSYSIVVPPPNANGNLHLGHALVVALEDISVRYHRLKGERALLLPGADHAGFETQVVFERQLAKEGKSRFDFSRDELYSRIYEFVSQNRAVFEKQFRRLGASVDWSRATFTLDQKIVDQAYATFKKMWDEGLIYRGERLVNFCTFHGTAFADIEVEHKEEQGYLWHIRYELTDGSGELVVATTRPETLFGDMAVAVHPDDRRYQKFIGKTVKLPLTNREIPVIADDFVDQKFGTGAVKITPAHDPNDFEAGRRHDLPQVTVITFEGTMAADVPEAYRGLTVDEARKKVADDLEKIGVLTKTESHVHSVGHCYKCSTVIQPLLREQWFLNVKPLAAKAIAALNGNKVIFHPDSKKAQLVTYLENLRDWNLSRQTAWGIPIPAFQNVDNPDDWLYDTRVDQEIIEVAGKTYRRDSDTFDTWFSSSSWPYATMNFGNPDSTDFNDFYPLSLMETGGDILYPWVSRMLMFGLYVTGEIPFKEVYLHGLILDEHGQKMSKSKGNVISPVETLDEYGSDALRMGMITGMSAGNNQPFGMPKVVGARNFCNKLWNIARYIDDKIGSHKVDLSRVVLESDADHWMMSKLQHTTNVMSDYLENYRFAEAYETLYHFVWDDVADWYIEASKAKPNLDLLAYTLDAILKLAHPFAPFMTETIWQTLAWQSSGMLITARWPEPQRHDGARALAFEAVKDLVTEVRAVMHNVGLTSGTLLYSNALAVEQNAATIKQLTRLDTIKELENETGGLKLTQTSFDCWLDIDVATAQAYRSKLDEQHASEELNIQRLKQRLGNKSYVDHAPEHVVSQTKDQLEEATLRLEGIALERKRFTL